MLIGVFPLTPLLAIVLLRPDPARLRRWSLRGAVAVSLGALALSPLIAVGKAWYGRDSEDGEPRKEAALAATRVLAATRRPRRCAFVAGSFRYDNAAAFYSPERPSAFVNFDYFGNRWATPEKLAARGLLTICRKDDRRLPRRDREIRDRRRRAARTITLAHAAFGSTRGPRRLRLHRDPAALKLDAAKAAASARMRSIIARTPLERCGVRCCSRPEFAEDRLRVDGQRLARASCRRRARARWRRGP